MQLSSIYQFNKHDVYIYSVFNISGTKLSIFKQREWVPNLFQHCKCDNCDLPSYISINMISTTILYLTKVLQSYLHLSSVNEFLICTNIVSTPIVSFLPTSPAHNRAHHKLIVDTSCLVPPITLLRYRMSYLESRLLPVYRILVRRI